MSLHGQLKVMNSSKGSRIQEELNGTIRIFTPDEWKAELEQRMKDAEAKPKPKTKAKDEDLEALGVRDADDSEDEADEIEPKVIAPKKVKKPKVK